MPEFENLDARIYELKREQLKRDLMMKDVCECIRSIEMRLKLIEDAPSAPFGDATKYIIQLREENDTLRKHNSELISELDKMRNSNNSLKGQIRSYENKFRNMTIQDIIDEAREED